MVSELKFNKEEFYYIQQVLLNKQIIVTGFIGKGYEGIVFSGAQGEKELAIKIIHAGYGIRVHNEEEDIDSKLQFSAYFVKYLDRFYSPDKKFFFFISEYLFCDLHLIMTNYEAHKQKFTINQLIIFAQQITTALLALQEKKIFHSDIKPRNILFDSKMKNFKLTDFGMSKVHLMIDQNYTRSMIGRTYKYSAPEILSGVSEINIKSDIYSLGMILLELTLGKFLTNEEAFQMRNNQLNEEELLNQEDQFKCVNKLILKMLKKDSRERISVDSLNLQLVGIQDLIKGRIDYLGENNQDFSLLYQQKLYNKKLLFQNQASYIQKFFSYFNMFDIIPQLSNARHYSKIFKEHFCTIQDLTENGIVVTQITDCSLNFLICGLADSLYEGYIIHGELQFTHEYPYKPPVVLFQQNIFHPYIQDKQIDVDIFRDQWSPAITSIRVILLSIQNALNELPDIQISNCGLLDLNQTLQKAEECKKNMDTIEQFMFKLQLGEQFNPEIKENSI